MASRKIFHAKPSYIYPTPPGIDTAIASESCIFEFDDADLWKSSADHHHHQASTVSNVEVRKGIPSSRSSKKLAKKMDVVGDHHHHHHNHRRTMASASLPVNIPDWSKILKDEYREHNKRESDEEGDDNINSNSNNNNHHEDEYYGLVPPHEYLAMRRGASFSVHEGVGRTLKGRDLRRVRNAIWKKVGFED